MIRAVCLGEAMIELRPVGGDLFAHAVAGDVYNAAVYLKLSLDASASVAFVTALGDDPLSATILADVEGYGLTTDKVFIRPGELPGLYLIELDATGDRSFHYWRSASAAKHWLGELIGSGGPDALAGQDLVYLSGISLAILSPQDRKKALDLLTALKGRVGRIAFDPNIRPRLWPDLDSARDTVEAVCAIADIVLPSQADGELIWREADPQRQLDRYAGLGASEIALTLGADGVRVRSRHGDIALGARAREVRDTSGAGDSFNGAYLAARLKNLSEAEAADAGLNLAAQVVALPGALPRKAASTPRLYPSTSPLEREIP